MKIELGRVVILVENYDLALDFYQKALGCHIIFDQTTPEGKRYVHVGFKKKDTTGLWFLKAETEEELKQVGHQTLGQPMMVLYTNDLEKVYQRLKDNQVKISKQPVVSPGYKFLHFLDLYGNEIIMVEMS
ncbi:VOC family protein [Fulvivirgaceae bacterium BMA12]|uniref:VOC family protein n=1 Tax=Agaribacillus aureus TaxID=3051825 RepID=A0ABT8LFX4_9BACT|nr:VOC family protein [Fulvivirgaceae bacterium BMA12]